MSIRSQRKEEHLALAQMFFNKQKKNSFDQMHLLRPALPEQAVNAQRIRTTMFGKTVAAPFFINAMTGGSEKSLKINQALGKIAAKEQIGLALGSASILVKEKKRLNSFYIARAENPHGVLIANINPETPASAAQKIVDELEADALQVHLNAVQEVAMPEGDRDFHWLDNLRALRQRITIPIIIKEVGFGLDQKTIHLLKKEGFNWFDVAGAGGTNFVQIENQRNARDVSYLKNIGLPTVISALMAQKEKVDFIVSGGVRNPLDVLKGLVLDAKFVGISNVFLHYLQEEGQEKLETIIHAWKDELSGLLALYGKNDLRALTEIKAYYDLPLKNQIEQVLK